jgi:predicted branched-subunit amino acid permease
MITNIIMIGFVPFGIVLGMLMYLAGLGSYKEEN